jgi:hypothetical protein
MAKRFTVEGIARYGVVGVNFIFLILGIVTLILGAVGFVKQQQMLNNNNELSSFNLNTIMIIILISGIGTMCCAIMGIIGAFLRISNILKLYCLILLCVICLQIGMGAWVLNLSISSLQGTWYDPTPSGISNRIAFQNYMNCCGWQTWSDSIAQLYTPCPYTPANGFVGTPTTCQDSANNFMKTYMDAVAIGAIIIAVFEALALITTFILIFKGKAKDGETGFEY